MISRILYITAGWALRSQERRDTFVASWLEKLPAGAAILDAGAGEMRYKKYCHHLQYTSHDFGEYHGGEFFAGEQMPTWRAAGCDLISDITSIPAGSESFDYILCTEVIEHVSDAGAALGELARLLRDNGELLVTAPFRSYYHQVPYFFSSGFSAYWFKHIAQREGMVCKDIQEDGSFASGISADIGVYCSCGSRLKRIVRLIASIPLLLILRIDHNRNKEKLPRSCSGYYVIMKKTRTGSNH